MVGLVLQTQVLLLPAPSSPQNYISYISGASAGGVETDQMLQHSRLMRFKTFFLPLQTYTLLS